MKSKKLYLFSLLLIGLFACQNNIEDEQLAYLPMRMPEKQGKEIITIEEAVNLANLGKRSLLSLSESEKRMIDSDKIFYIPNTNSDVNNNGVYFVNFKDCLGYAIIAADRIQNPILAVTTKGRLDENYKEMPGVEGFLHTYLSIDVNKFKKSNDFNYLHKYDTVTYTIDSIAPRVEVEWGQMHPAGDNCPNGLAGCVTLAAAQALSYVETPSYIDLYYSSQGVGSNTLTIKTFLHWNNMKSDIVSTNITPQPSSYDYELANLCRELCHRCNAVFYPNATDIHPLETMRDVLAALAHTRQSYTVSPIYNLFPNVEYDLNYGIIIYGGYRYESATQLVGHTFVIDGYTKINVTVNDYIISRPNNIFVGEVSNNDITYSHINWGWNGSSNGYFLEGVYGVNNHNYTEMPSYFMVN